MRLLVPVICLLLASCKTAAPVVATHASSAPSPKAALPSATAAPATPKPAPSVAQLDSVALSGKIQLDAAYIVAQGAGNIVAQGGGNIVAQGGGNVISAKQDLAALGAQLIGNDGAGAVAAVSAGLITNDGAGIVAQGAGNFRVLADGEVSGSLPAAGMAVQAINAATNRPILMVDGKGHVGKWVLSDGGGNFKLFVPRSLQDNVIIQAQPPAKLADPRLRLGCLAKPSDQKEIAVDEATSLASSFCRDALVAKLRYLLVPDLTTPIKDPHLQGPQLALLENLRVTINQALKDGKTEDFTDRQRKALAIRLATFVLSKIPFADIPLDRTVDAYDGPEEPAFAAVDGVLRVVLDGAGAKLKAKPTFFDDQAFITRFNGFATTNGRKPFEIKTPSDVGAFIGEAYIAGNEDIASYTESGEIFTSTQQVLAVLGDAEAEAHSKRLRAGVNGVSRAVIFKLLERVDDVVAIIQGMAKPELRAELDLIDTEGR